MEALKLKVLFSHTSFWNVMDLSCFHPYQGSRYEGKVVFFPFQRCCKVSFTQKQRGRCLQRHKTLALAHPPML